MAQSLEELVILKRIALKYLLFRQSRLFMFGKRPVNKKLAHALRVHTENNVWSSFMDSLNEDLTRNINVFDWRVLSGDYRDKNHIKFLLEHVPEETIRSFPLITL